MKTDTILRMFRGEVVAMFPGIAGTADPDTCTCYGRVGQHSSATVRIMRYSRKATRAECASLLRELRGIGYSIRVVFRFTKSHRRHRLRQIGRVA